MSARLFGRAMSCPHLGPLLRTADGTACGCTQVPIHECRLHGVETALKACRDPEKRTLWKGRDCLTCRAEGENAAFTLLRRPEHQIGHGYHRAGWPFAMSALAPFAGTEAPLAFEDFVEQRFCYDRQPQPIRQPWVGVFHHPATIPHWTGIASNGWDRLIRRSEVRESLPFLRGAVCMSELLAAWLRTRFNVPILTVPHPTDLDVPQWRPESLDAPRIAQVGWYLRNVRAAFQVAWPAGWTVQRHLRDQPHVRQHDDLCWRHFVEREHRDEPSLDRVATVWSHLDNAAYDDLLATSIVFTEIVAAAANNVVVECWARATPILVNRSPAVVEYLGPDYPLFWDTLDDVPRLLDRQRLLAAHEYLRQRPKDGLRPEHFARRVVDFCLSLKRAP